MFSVCPPGGLFATHSELPSGRLAFNWKALLFWDWFLVTARVRSTTGRLCFDMRLSFYPSINLSVHRGGVSPARGGGSVQPGGVSPAGRGGSVQPVGGEVSPAGGGSVQSGGGSGTHYKAGGMPLAFTQEDFLVFHIVYDQHVTIFWTWTRLALKTV